MMQLLRDTMKIRLFLLLLASLQGAYAVNFTDCFINFRNHANQTLNASGLVDAHGGNIANTSSEISNAVAFTYDACLSQCGSGIQKPTWANISQQFSAWLLPYLALISQLPFGARHRVDNLMSAVLTVGSPVLAGYSMILTILNARWISRRFETVSFPNARDAARILISLQQTPLKITNEDSLLSSLVVLPENDDWWPTIADFLDYTLTWSIASATSIAWVVVAYILTVVGSLSDVNANLNTNGQGTGSVWLWLIPIVIGWLQLSPKCDYVRIKRAMDNADAMAFVATHNGVKKASALSERRAISIDSTLEQPSSPDEDSSPPVYNYARAIPWSRSAEDVFDAFRMASNNFRAHRPVRTGDTWKNADRRNIIEPCNRSGNPSEVNAYCRLPRYAAPRYGVRNPWASGIFFRMFVASLLPLALQWATTGAAVLVVYFTPTVGLGCRSLGYIIYGALATMVWAMLIMSSIISHYTYSYSGRSSWSPFFSIAMRLAKILSNLLRRGGKFVAIVNSIWVVTGAMLQFTDVYDNCYCNSSVLGRGAQYGYDIVITANLDLGLTKAAWWGALALACSTSLGFIFLMSLLTDRVPT
ncbi:hypothetical protein DEU56DRAFT_894887 [Suillus clintonianus]|uniref:uncharacterized protein n=1 Tax=Suillus clintonianus TaxID=1904413 RepID=UPI001B87FDE0|nr:uncharacterized protein DEU56DRAFT_894887 [Suillus clintonianus]KAG2120251.1 hypothetical protein DEU56DRAFT_894887 [Suillus clintonianus]